mgnify:CR=1 FL=1
MNTKIKLMLTATIVTLFGSSCRSKVIMYDQANGRYVEGKPAKELLSQQEKVLKAREQARDREHERNLERRDASRYVTRESVLFGQSVDEFDVLAARERALQAEADVARTQAQNAESVSLVGFGTFLVRERAARTGRNPQTGATIQIAAAKVPAFKAGKALKDALN